MKLLCGSHLLALLAGLTNSSNLMDNFVLISHTFKSINIDGSNINLLM